MAHSISRILLHVIFSTKNREPWLDPAIRPRLHSYLAGAIRALNAKAYRVGGVAEHVHVACQIPRTIQVSKLLESIKASSSKWLKQQSPIYNGFTWQSGYGAFSIGPSQFNTLLAYIENQEEHHRFRTFEEEYIDFLNQHGIRYDAQHLWD